MKYGRVLTYKDKEEAKKLIGKKVIVCDYLVYIEENPEGINIAILEEIKGEAYPFYTNDGDYQFIREVIEEQELMTNRQLVEWTAKGNGEYTYKGSDLIYLTYCYCNLDANAPVPDSLRIRSWDSEQWVVPTVDIYERDCNGGSK